MILSDCEEYISFGWATFKPVRHSMAQAGGPLQENEEAVCAQFHLLLAIMVVCNTALELIRMVEKKSVCDYKTTAFPGLELLPQ